MILPGGHVHPRSLLRICLPLLAVLIPGLVLSGCATSPQAPHSAARVLQSVQVTLTSGGAVHSVEGTAIYLDSESKQSTTTSTQYQTRKVASDLPVRITTQYHAGNKTGSDFADLRGYSGRVTLDLTVENLTLNAQNVSYDVAGAANSSPALVGTPLSIVASTVLAGVAPSSVLSDDDLSIPTQGVVSRTPKGDSAVQWAAILAPPQTGATTTFELSADVKNFTVPQFNVAIQPGIHTDLSFDQLMSSAFGTDAASALGVQQRTIALIGEVNSVLARAGGTITEVRENLDSTSSTLGVKTVQSLRDSSESLTASLQSLGQKLVTLQGELSASVNSSQNALSAQLRATVADLIVALGDTAATVPPNLAITDCRAQSSPPVGDDATLYSSFLRLSGQLRGYSQQSEACQKDLINTLASFVGPEEPDVSSCAQPSMTCALYSTAAQVSTIMTSIMGVALKQVDSLGSQTLTDAQSSYAVASGSIKSALARLGDSLGQGMTSVDFSALVNDLASARDALLELEKIHDQALSQVATLGDAARSGSILGQTADLADQLCSYDLKITADQRERLRSYLTGQGCDGVTALAPPAGYPAPLSVRLKTQQQAWTDLAAATDTAAGSHSSLAMLQNALSVATSDLATQVSNNTSHQETLNGIFTELTNAQPDLSSLGDSLNGAIADQNALKNAIKEALSEAESDVNTSVLASINDQIRTVSTSGVETQKDVTEAYQNIIDGLDSASDTILDDARNTINGHKDTLTKTRDSAAAALAEQTASALEHIAASSTSSSRDIVAATALLQERLAGVLLDLGDRSGSGSGLLGAMLASAAKSDAADLQLALASQNAAGYASIRGHDVSGILLAQAQFQAALKAAAVYPAFHLDLPAGASWQTLYTFQVGGDLK